MSNGPENSPQPPSSEQQEAASQAETNSWVPKFVVSGIQRAMHSIRQTRMDMANDELHDLDTSQTRHDKKVENAQYKDIPRATQNYNLAQIYDGLKEEPQTDGYVRANARRKFEKNDKVLSASAEKFGAIAEKSEAKKAKRRQKIETRKQKILEKDPTVVDKADTPAPNPNTVSSRDKARAKEVQDKLASNLSAAHSISIRELLRSMPEDSDSSEGTKIDDFTLRRSLKNLDGSAQALAAMTMATLQEKGVIDSEGNVTKSRSELQELITELDPEGNTANYRDSDTSGTTTTSSDTQTGVNDSETTPDEEDEAQNDSRPYMQEYRELPPAIGIEAATDQVISSSEDEEGNADSDGNESQEKTEDSNDEVKEEKATEDASSESEQELEDTENTEDTSEKKPENTEFKSTTGIDVATLQSLSKEISQSISDTVRATKQERNLGNEDKLPKQDYESIRDNSVEANIKAWLIDKGIVNKSNPELLERFYRHIKTDLDNYRKHVRS